MQRFAVLATMLVGIAGLGLLHAATASPAVGHPTRTVVTAQGFVTFGGAIRIRAAIHSTAPNPIGTCFVQEQLAWRWSTTARVNTTTGACSVRLRPSHRGTELLRVHFAGSSGWGSSTSTPITVLVR